MDHQECQTITVQEAGKRLGIGRDLAYRLANERCIPVLRLGNRFVVPVVALDRWMANGGTIESEEDQ